MRDNRNEAILAHHFRFMISLPLFFFETILSKKILCEFSRACNIIFILIHVMKHVSLSWECARTDEDGESECKF